MSFLPLFLYVTVYALMDLVTIIIVVVVVAAAAATTTTTTTTTTTSVFLFYRLIFSRSLQVRPGSPKVPQISLGIADARCSMSFLSFNNRRCQSTEWILLSDGKCMTLHELNMKFIPN